LTPGSDPEVRMDREVQLPPRTGAAFGPAERIRENTQRVASHAGHPNFDRRSGFIILELPPSKSPNFLGNLIPIVAFAGIDVLEDEALDLCELESIYDQ
jgi:hypothetical protein